MQGALIVNDICIVSIHHQISSKNSPLQLKCKHFTSYSLQLDTVQFIKRRQGQRLRAYLRNIISQCPLNNSHKRKYGRPWAFLFTESTVFCVANACHWVGPMNKGQESVEPRGLSWGPYKSLGQFSIVPLFEQSGGLNTEHPEEALLKWQQSFRWNEAILLISFIY